MITKETFCAIIRALQKSNNNADIIDRELCNTLEKHNRFDFGERGTFAEWFCDWKLQDEIINVLESEMNDCDKWIEYYTYELDFGNNYKDGCVIENDGKTHIKLRTPEDLYDLLLSNMGLKEDNLSIETVIKILQNYASKLENKK